MALIKCSGCGHMVSDKGIKCPKCGTPIHKAEETGKPIESNEKETVEPNSSKVEIQECESPDIGVEADENPMLTTSHKNYGAVLSGLIILALLGSAYYWWQNKKSSETCDPQEEQTSNLVSSEEDLNTYAGLTFRTFTESEYDENNSVTYQSRLIYPEVIDNLKECGFILSDTKTESRLDYTGEDYYDVTIETYTKIVNGHVTTVILESEYTEIHFPNLNDVEEFKKTIQACGLNETEDGFADPEEVYWGGTDVSIKGTTVTLSYRFEM